MTSLIAQFLPKEFQGYSLSKEQNTMLVLLECYTMCFKDHGGHILYLGGVTNPQMLFHLHVVNETSNIKFASCDVKSVQSFREHIRKDQRQLLLTGVKYTALQEILSLIYTLIQNDSSGKSCIRCTYIEIPNYHLVHHYTYNGSYTFPLPWSYTCTARQYITNALIDPETSYEDYAKILHTTVDIVKSIDNETLRQLIAADGFRRLFTAVNSTTPDSKYILAIKVLEDLLKSYLVDAASIASTSIATTTGASTVSTASVKKIKELEDENAKLKAEIVQLKSGR